MSESIAIDQIMSPHVGCYVYRKETEGHSGKVLELRSDMVKVHWGVQDGHEVTSWEPAEGLVVRKTAKQVKAEEEAREKARARH